MTCVTALETVLRDEIDASGPISFARFMEVALYHPELGYYRKGVDPFGVQGDFFTASQLQPVFGEAIAKYVSQVAADEPDLCDVVELGAGRQELRDAFEQKNYRAFDWNTRELPEHFRGVVIANEFFDALPVHLMKKSQKGWTELAVAANGERFFLQGLGAAAGPLLEYAKQYGSVIPIGGLLEVGLELQAWTRRLSELLLYGYVLVIDYGYSANQLDRFPRGTLVAYKKHQAEDELLLEAGMRDLTAHVNFTYLRECAVENGFEVIKEQSLKAWLMGLWTADELAAKWKVESDRWRLQWKQIVFGMGESFRVLMLRKGL